MNIKEVKDLIHEILQSDISEFELEHTGTKVRLKRGLSRDAGVVLPAPSASISVGSSSSPLNASEADLPPSESAEESEENNLHIITSPIVGTFYRAPTPGAEPYVKPGALVEEGSILCIIEAMKLMNEIPSDVEGEVVRIYVEDGHPVEFAQKLFAIRPRKQG
jgi:acetyl-CoA carboxylase biotin carboxyl carrier protein